MKSKLLTAIYIIAVWVLIVTFSISIPIYCRPFYYAQISPLDLELISGKSKTEIKDAYNEVLNYLTLPYQKFGTGVFPHSQEGKSHFEDCKGLFILNISLLAGSFVTVFAFQILKKKKIIKLCKPFKLPPYTLSAILIIIPLLFIGTVAIFDFTALFYGFHGIFFSGKDNWLFDSVKDPIIDILPLEFFLNCAVLIAISLVIISIGLLILGFIKRKND